MREILFKGKRVDNGEWVEGWYAPLVCNDKTVIPYIRDINGTDWKIIPETVGQYTGLTDKNGNKIFEGDIVYYYISPYHKRFIVEFFDGAFVIKNKGNHIRSPLYHFCPLVEVIGNIHDNPELLEDK